MTPSGYAVAAIETARRRGDTRAAMPSPSPASSAPGPTLPLTRLVAGAIVLILADAAQLLLFFPSNTGDDFAWNIKPDLTALVLASAYVGGGYFFVRVFWGGPWDRVAAGFPPVIVFVWFAAGATFLHLDKFNHGSVPFIVWLVLYIATPLGVPLLYRWNSRAVRPGADRAPPELPRRLRGLLFAAGAAVTGFGAFMFLAPGPTADLWPWTLTPLTCRIVAAVVALYGAVWISVAVNGTRTGARVPLEAHMIGLAFVLWAMARRHGDIDWGDGMAVALLAVTVTMLVASAGVYVATWMRPRAPAMRPVPEPTSAAVAR
jgi:predicted secreted protein